ncbi:hypothetical protein IDM40_05880 [Nocardiopsis sp. HNM0947]|uniref:Uncharacterized protein n=1 Tax=Nocardiopsis coralli TaxID=2772213 RepID=A0ABR9P343_9ACTN|nr:hypothetical protein [Nocardiopsis coralli]MBE2998234.1 hypothetical protein [Nocardiopsis coralli]
MFNNARTSARTLLLAAGTAGFVALGSGFATAEPLPDATGAIDGAAGQVPGAETLPATELPGTEDVTAPGVPSVERTVTNELDGLLSEADVAQIPELASLAEIAELEGVEGVALGDIDGLDTAAPQVPALDGAVPQVDVDSYTSAAEAATLPARFYAAENVDPDEIVQTVEHTTVPVLFIAADAQSDVDALADEVGAVADGALSGVGADVSGIEQLALGSADDLAGGVPTDLEVLEVADLPVDTDLPVDGVETGDVVDGGATENLPATGDVTEELPQTDEVGADALPEVPAVDGVEDTVDEVTDVEGLPTDAVGTELDDVTGDVTEDVTGDVTEDLTGAVDTDAVDTELVDGLL